MTREYHLFWIRVMQILQYFVNKLTFYIFFKTFQVRIIRHKMFLVEKFYYHRHQHLNFEFRRVGLEVGFLDFIWLGPFQISWILVVKEWDFRPFARYLNILCTPRRRMPGVGDKKFSIVSFEAKKGGPYKNTA